MKMRDNTPRSNIRFATRPRLDAGAQMQKRERGENGGGSGQVFKFHGGGSSSRGADGKNRPVEVRRDKKNRGRI